MNSSMSDRHSPVFVIGNPRSGTTLLRLLIASHKNICIPPECGFALWLEKTRSGWSKHDLESPTEIQGFLDDLIACRKFDTWNLPRENVLAQIQERQPESFSALIEAVYRAYLVQNKPEASRWGDKNNFHVQHVADLNNLFPDSKFIHIVRDVRDVACSYRELKSLDSASPYRPNLPFEIEEICNEWKTNVQAVLAAFSNLAMQQTMAVRYEDIVLDPSGTSESICSFLDEEYDAEMLNFHLHDLEPKQTMDWKTKTRSPVSPVSLERFRRDLPAAETATATLMCHDLLSQFGYSSIEK